MGQGDEESALETVHPDLALRTVSSSWGLSRGRMPHERPHQASCLSQTRSLPLSQASSQGFSAHRNESLGSKTFWEPMKPQFTMSIHTRVYPSQRSQRRAPSTLTAPLVTGHVAFPRTRDSDMPVVGIDSHVARPLASRFQPCLLSRGPRSGSQRKGPLRNETPEQYRSFQLPWRVCSRGKPRFPQRAYCS